MWARAVIWASAKVFVHFAKFTMYISECVLICLTGDCDKDSHCKGKLRCWQRDYHTTYVEQLPPGCVGDRGKILHIKNRDYCYDPAKNGDATPTYFVFEFADWESAAVLLAIVSLSAVLIVQLCVMAFKRVRAAKERGYAKVVMDSEMSEAEDLVNKL